MNSWLRHAGRRTGLGAALLGAALLVGACGGGDPADPEVQQAAIEATVTLDGAAASGVNVRLFGSGGGEALALRQTGSDGVARFTALTPGSYEVEVEVPAGAELSGESARRPVSASAGATAAVTFVLTTPGAPQAVVVMATGNLTFEPADVTIAPGQTVIWRNSVTMLHDVTPDGHSEWTAGTLSSAGDEFAHTFQNTGTFPYVCTLHVGMSGTVRVQ
jgi:plastocyanin